MQHTAKTIDHLRRARIEAAACVSKHRNGASQSLRVLGWTLGLWTLSTLCLAQPVEPPLVLEHANLLSEPDAAPSLDVIITIAAGRIESIPKTSDPSPAQPAGQRIDLRGAWVLPGLIDAHVHVQSIPSAQRMLALGITTGRSMLTTGYEDVGLKAMFQRGAKDLPEILSAGLPVVARPGAFQPDLSALFLRNPDLDDLRFAARIGARGAQRVVAANAAYHVDWIKVFANGRAGVLSSDPASRELNDEELNAAIQEATAHGMRVAAHGYSDEGVAAAVRAGVRTIEHGALITEPTLILMREHRVCLTPTLSAFYAHSRDNRPDASSEQKALAAREQMLIKRSREAVTIARRVGVALIAGADTSYDSAEEPTVIDEILRLHDAGLTPVEALAAASTQAAACLGIERRKGAVRPGLDADLVVYADNPITDLQLLRTPLMVITRGHIYLDNRPRP